MNTIKTKSTNKYLPVNSNRGTNNKLNNIKNIKNKKNKKKVNFNKDIKEEIFHNNKSISENKYIYKYPTKYGTELPDTHYLLYTNLSLGVPQYIIDSYKLFKKKKGKTPENKKIEYLRTFEDQLF